MLSVKALFSYCIWRWCRLTIFCIFLFLDFFFHKRIILGWWGYRQKNRNLDKLCTGGGVPDKTTLEQSLSNHGRKRTAGVVKRKKAGVEKSRNRTHCGVGEEWAAAREKKKRGDSVTTVGLMISGHIWTLVHNTDAVFVCKEDRVVQPKRAGIWRVKTRHPNCLFQQLAG